MAIAAVLLAGCCAIAATAGATNEVRVWTATSLANVLQSARPPVDAPTALALESARDEWEHGQIVVQSDSPITGLRASISDLRGSEGRTIPAANCSCRFVAYILVEKNTHFTPPEELVATAPCKVPDALLEQETIRVEAGNAQPIWVTMHVPKDAGAGITRGQSS